MTLILVKATLKVNNGLSSWSGTGAVNTKIKILLVYWIYCVNRCTVLNCNVLEAVAQQVTPFPQLRWQPVCCSMSVGWSSTVVLGTVLVAVLTTSLGSCGGVFSVAGVTGNVVVLRGQADVFPDKSLSDDNVQKVTQLCFLLTILKKRWVDQVIMWTYCSHWCSAGCSTEPPPPQPPTTVAVKLALA